MSSTSRWPEQAVPDWDNAGGGHHLRADLHQQDGKVDGVLAANDGLGNAVISILRKNGAAG
jgi:D-xylose transport system substrate-binding protein